MKINFNQIFSQGLKAHKEGRLEEAERLYREILKAEPENLNTYNNLGAILQQHGKADEAEKCFKKVLELKPDDVEAYNNLGVILKDSCKFNEAEACYRKAIGLKPDYETAHNNLDILLKEKDLLANIFKIRRSIKKNKLMSVDSNIRLVSNPYITHRNVEVNLIKDFYKGKFKKLDKTEKKDARYGNGNCSDFNFFKNDSLVLKNIEADLINIMSNAVESDIYVFDSFLNIFRSGSGTTPHAHIVNFDKTQGLVKQKYSLTYYLSVGDQNCSQPGNLQLYNPHEEIKLSEGMVVIIPAGRKHCAVYNGKTDRIMIGINFYSLT